MQRTKENMSPDEAFILTLYGEARGEGEKGIVAVAHVINNRLKAQKKYYGLTLKDVCLKPYQFSCWNDNDPNSNMLLNIDWNDSKLSACKTIGMKFLENPGEDFTQNSTHYHTKNCFPKWAENKNPVVEVGNHLFYNDVD